MGQSLPGYSVTSRWATSPKPVHLENMASLTSEILAEVMAVSFRPNPKPPNESFTYSEKHFAVISH